MAFQVERTSALECLIVIEAEKSRKHEEKLQFLEKEKVALTPRQVEAQATLRDERPVLDQKVKNVGYTIEALQRRLACQDNVVEELCNKIEEW